MRTVCSVTVPEEHYWVALAKSALGECLTIQKRYEEAEPLLLRGYNDLKAALGEQQPRTAEAKQRLLALYQAWDKPDQIARYR